jgi:DNA-binding SARP family transcriptional activator
VEPNAVVDRAIREPLASLMARMTLHVARPERIEEPGCAMDRLTVSLFGGFFVRRFGDLVPGFESAKVQELLGYILLNRHRPHLRETLAGLLWGDSTTSQSKKYLRQTLWQLQSAFETGVARGEHSVLLIHPEWVSLNPEAEVWFDVAIFERAYESARSIPSHALSTESVQQLRVAVELYRGDLLEGCYHDWCLFERERLLNAYLTMLDKLTGHCETTGDFEGGAEFSGRILRYDRAKEQTHRRLMRIAYLAGDRTGALRQYESCVTALEEELGIRPSSQTVALYELIRADRGMAPLLTEDKDVAPSQALRETAGRLRRLVSTLVEFESQLQDEIQVIEQTITHRGPGAS